MVKELSYNTIALVLESWEELRRIPNYDEVSGSLLFQHLFVAVPETKALFGFAKDADPLSEELLKSTRFVSHAGLVMRLFNNAFDMVGPDDEFLTEMLETLGKRHVRFGVRPEYFIPVGEALLYAMEELLGKYFTEQMKEAWLEMYLALADDMIRTIKAHEEHKDTLKNRFQEGGAPVRLEGEK